MNIDQYKKLDNGLGAKKGRGVAHTPIHIHIYLMGLDLVFSSKIHRVNWNKDKFQPKLMKRNKAHSSRNRFTISVRSSRMLNFYAKLNQQL